METNRNQETRKLELQVGNGKLATHVQFSETLRMTSYGNILKKILLVMLNSLDNGWFLGFGIMGDLDSWKPMETSGNREFCRFTDVQVLQGGE